MAFITLDRTWITLVSSGASVQAFTGRGRAVDSSKDGEVRRLAGGRFRAVSKLGTKRTQTFALRDLLLADIATLESWLGQLVLVRDNRGRRLFGVYFDVPYADRLDVYYDVSLSIQETSYDENA